jgi:hypothetical protein
MPEQRGPTKQNTEALNTAGHSRHSSYREMLLEHLLVGEVISVEEARRRSSVPSSPLQSLISSSDLRLHYTGKYGKLVDNIL